MTGQPDTVEDSVQDRLDAYWTGRAPAYDDYQHRAERLADDEAVWAGVWGSALGGPPLDVLDVGTGSGQVAITVARLGHRVTGIDLSDGMLARARAHAAAEASPPTIRRGDAVAPDVADASFDAVVGRYVTWTLREPDRAIAAWCRLLRPGGLVAVVDTTWFPGGLEQGGETFTATYDERAGAVLPLVAASSIDATAAVLTDGGLEDVTITPLTSVLDLDRRHGVAPGHDVRLQYLLTGRTSAGPPD